MKYQQKNHGGENIAYRISSNKRPGRLFFEHFFLKKLFNKNAIKSNFSFFWPYKGLRGAFIREGRLLEEIR
jgi:hypothetical protein